MVELFRMFLDELDIGVERAFAIGEEAALDPTPEGRFLVAGKIKLGPSAHFGQQALERGQRQFLDIGRWENGARLGEARKFVGDLLWGLDPVHASGIDSGLGHAVVTRRPGILGEVESAPRFDRAHAAGAIRSGSRKDDSDGVFLSFFGEGGKKEIDRRFRGNFPGGFDELQDAVAQDDIPVGGCDVDGIGNRGLAIHRFDDRQRRFPAEQLGQHALVGRGQVLDHHIGHAGPLAQIGDQGGEGFQPPRGGADSDHVVVMRPSLLHGRRSGIRNGSRGRNRYRSVFLTGRTSGHGLGLFGRSSILAAKWQPRGARTAPVCQFTGGWTACAMRESSVGEQRGKSAPIAGNKSTGGPMCLTTRRWTVPRLVERITRLILKRDMLSG